MRRKGLTPARISAGATWGHCTVAPAQVEATVACQLVGVYNGTQEVKAPLRTQYRSMAGLGSFPASLSELPGAGVNLALLGVGLLVGAIAGYWIGKRRR